MKTRVRPINRVMQRTCKIGANGRGGGRKGRKGREEIKKVGKWMESVVENDAAVTPDEKLQS